MTIELTPAQLRRAVDIFRYLEAIAAERELAKSRAIEAVSIRFTGWGDWVKLYDRQDRGPVKRDTLMDGAADFLCGFLEGRCDREIGTLKAELRAMGIEPKDYLPGAGDSKQHTAANAVLTGATAGP